MRRSMIACLAAIVAIPAFAAGFGLKPGLWETRIVKQVVDGRDMSSQIAGASAQMQQAMANMPPEQRARMEAMMKQHGGPAIASDGAIRICISPEMASRDRPIVDREGHCQPAVVNHSGNHTTFEFNCNSNGTAMTGKGESTSTGDLIKTQMEMTRRKANGETHVMQSETEMKFLGSDCGDVKPIPAPKSPP
jgi:hypothetical protein